MIRKALPGREPTDLHVSRQEVNIDDVAIETFYRLALASFAGAPEPGTDPHRDECANPLSNHASRHVIFA